MSQPAPTTGEQWPDEVTALVTRCVFPPAGEPLDCAVSGGPDSLALLALAVAAGCRVTAIHVDHGLRPGSAAEAEIVRSAAERFGARFRSERVEVAPGPNLEARARAARLGALPDGVATGHTMDDQAETMLCNLLRGAGLDGLAGMSPGPTHPLLGIRRADTAALCAALGLDPFLDPSNADPRHLRNRVRHELLPLCAGIAQRDPVPVLARQSVLLRDEARYLDDAAGVAVPDPTDAKGLRDAPLVLARRALRRWLTTGNGRTDRHPPSSAEVERVLEVARGERVGAELSGGRVLRRTRGRLVLQGETTNGGRG